MTSASEYASSPISDTPTTLARIDTTLDAHSTRLDHLHTRLKELEDTTPEPTTPDPAPAITATLTEDGTLHIDAPGMDEWDASTIMHSALSNQRSQIRCAEKISLARSDYSEAH